MQRAGRADPGGVLQRLEDGGYAVEGKAACGRTLRLPEPLAAIDPADLRRRG